MTSLRPAASILGGGKEASSGEGGTKWVAVGNNKKKLKKTQRVVEMWRKASGMRRIMKEMIKRGTHFSRYLTLSSPSCRCGCECAGCGDWVRLNLRPGANRAAAN